MIGDAGDVLPLCTSITLPIGFMGPVNCDNSQGPVNYAQAPAVTTDQLWNLPTVSGSTAYVDTSGDIILPITGGGYRKITPTGSSSILTGALPPGTNFISTPMPVPSSATQSWLPGMSNTAVLAIVAGLAVLLLAKR